MSLIPRKCRQCGRLRFNFNPVFDVCKKCAEGIMRDMAMPTSPPPRRVTEPEDK